MRLTHIGLSDRLYALKSVVKENPVKVILVVATAVTASAFYSENAPKVKAAKEAEFLAQVQAESNAKAAIMADTSVSKQEFFDMVKSVQNDGTSWVGFKKYVDNKKNSEQLSSLVNNAINSKDISKRQIDSIMNLYGKKMKNYKAITDSFKAMSMVKLSEKTVQGFKNVRVK